MKSSSRWLVTGLWIACLILFLSFRIDTTNDGRETRREASVGLWFSPWFTWTDVSHHEKTTSPGGGFSESYGSSWSWQMQLLSASWLVLGAGALLFWHARRRPAPAV